MHKALLPLIAALLVLTAIGGIVAGVAVMDSGDEHEPAVTEAAASAPESANNSGVGTRTAPPETDQPETGQPETTQPNTTEPEDFIRFGTRSAPARTPGTIRLATYNIENLFDDQDDPELSGRYEDIDDTKPEPHVRAVADAIRALDADIIALQEIESEAVVRWFRDTYLADMGYDHIASIDAGDQRGIEQAVLSRFPIASVTNWPRHPLGGVHPDKWGSGDNWNAGEPITFHRSPLRVDIDIPPQGGTGALSSGTTDAYRLTLYVVHAKSGGPGEYWRLSEARGLANQIKLQLAAEPAANIAVLGDFNAFLSDESVQSLTSAGLTDALAAVADRSPRFVTHESGRRIDHILINANLKPELIPASPFILGTPSLPEGIDWRQEWRPDGYASDHFPVAVEITPIEK